MPTTRSSLLSRIRPHLARPVGPLIPDGHTMVIEIFDVGVAGEKPKQLIDDRLEMKLFCRGERKTLTQVEAHLVPEHRQGSRAGTVLFHGTAGKNSLDQIQVLAHGSRLEGRRAESVGV